MAQIIAVSSGKGGVGKSSCCVLLGSALAKRGKKVLILELDFGLRGLDIMTGTQDQTVYDLGDVLSCRCEIEKAIVESAFEPNLHLIPAGLEFSSVAFFKMFFLICQKLSGSYDFIFLDLPAGISGPVQIAVKAADLILLIVTPDPISMRDGYRTSLFLEQQSSAPQLLLINRLRPQNFKGSGKKRVISNLDEVIDTVSVQLFGILKEDETICMCNSKGLPLPEKSDSAAAYDRIAGRLLGEPVSLSIE